VSAAQALDVGELLNDLEQGGYLGRERTQ